MKHIILISFLLITISAVCPDQATAQLITDSERKLKTQKKKKEGGFFDFLQRDNKRRSASGALQQQAKSSAPRYSPGSPFESFRRRQSAPRYSPADRKSMFRSKTTAPRYSPSGSPFRKPGFLGLKQKSPSGRTASGSPFRSRRSPGSPRYSPGSPFSTKFLTARPRYSPGTPFSSRQRTASPRYSPASPFSSRQLAASPRYSPGKPFSSRYRTTSPRYSPGSPFAAKYRSTSPRYSPGSPFASKYRATSPRYSPGSPYTAKFRSTSPRYSPGSPFLAKDYRRSPRYSPGSPFSGKGRVSPRYSPGSPFDGLRWASASPRYSTNKNRFDVDKSLKRQSRIYNFESSKYRGESRTMSDWLEDVADLGQSRITANFEGYKVPRMNADEYASHSRNTASYKGNYKAKWIKQRSANPGFNHTRARQDSEAIRESLRKWNRFMARINGNKVQPNAVTEKVSKPKFDRKEAEIWND